MYTQQLIMEAIIVGIVTMFSSYFFDTRKKLQIFIMGVSIHIVFELFGANKVYCKRGAACMN